MVNETLLSMYRMVCDAPHGSGICVERMPEMLERDPSIHMQAHTHGFYEIIWFREDGGVHTVDFMDYPVRRNRLFFLTPGQVHRFDGTATPGCTVKICSDCCAQGYGEIADLRHALFYANRLPYADLDEEGAAQLELLIERMEEEQELYDRTLHREMLCLMVQMLMIFILRHSHRTDALPAGAPTAQQNLYIRFRSMLEQQFMHLHLVADYSERLGISTKTLTMAVRACTGRTPLDLIDERITLEARRLLRFSDLKVKEVAYQLGFDTSSNFVKFFRRHDGALPGEYQKLR